MKINYMWLMNVTSDAMEAYKDYVEETKKTWKNLKELEEHRKRVNNKCHYSDKQNEALWAVQRVTGYSYNVLYNAVRIEQKYEKKHKYEKCLFFNDDVWEEEKRKKLFDCLSAKTPEDLKGIYNNEFCEGAIRRLENKRYDECHLYKY